MHITGVPDRTLMSIDWWRSLGFMVYIKHQISSFSTGISVRMVQFRPILEFVFFIGEYLLPTDALIKQFQYVTQIVLTLYNQKSAIQGETVSHLRSEFPAACPVISGVNIFLHL